MGYVKLTFGNVASCQLVTAVDRGIRDHRNRQRVERSEGYKGKATRGPNGVKAGKVSVEVIYILVHWDKK